MIVDKNRILNHLKELSKITQQDMPFTRRSFTPMYLEGRKYIENHFKSVGCECFIDGCANFFAIKKGISDKVILIGSHSDTVDGGGKYDGILGVVCAMEIASMLRDKDCYYTIVFVDYFAEETSVFGLSCIGSRALAGILTEEQLKLKHPKTGLSLKESLASMGAKGDIKKFDDLGIGKAVASLELHIEQGGYLENTNQKLGIVTAIVGITRYKVKFLGEANHSGTTPMNQRKDALVSASDFILWLNKEANEVKNAYLVSTVGFLNVHPNGPNIVPSEVEMIVDLRCDNDKVRNEFKNKIENKLKTYDVTFNQISDSDAVLSDDTIMDILEKSAKTTGEKYERMPSGAGHDSAYTAEFSKMGMVFIPSHKGVSHRQDEFSSDEDCVLGVEVVYKALIDIDENKLL